MSVATKARAASVRTIRDPEFARRLDQACDAYPSVPPKHSGRQSWIQRELSNRFSTDISPETVRKWFAGEAKPRPDKLAQIAQLLEVDVAWLSLGIDPNLEPRERKARNAMADGAVNVIAGLIQMDGGHVAFPKADAEDGVDLHAIIKGAKYDLHVSLGTVEGKSITFNVTNGYEMLLVLGVVRRDMAFDIVEIPAEMIAEGQHHGGSIRVRMTEAQIQRGRINGFHTRL